MTLLLLKSYLFSSTDSEQSLRQPQLYHGIHITVFIQIQAHRKCGEMRAIGIAHKEKELDWILFFIVFSLWQTVLRSIYGSMGDTVQSEFPHTRLHPDTDITDKRRDAHHNHHS